MLHDHAKASGLQIRAGIAERPGCDIGKKVSTGCGDFAGARKSGISHAIGIAGNLKIAFTDPLRQADLLMMRVLDLGRKTEQADTGIGFAHVGRSRIETLLGAKVGAGRGVVVCQDGVGGEMKAGESIRAESAQMPQELDGLQFAAELEFYNVAQGEIITGRKRQRLQGRTVQARVRRCEAADRNGHARIGTIGLMT